MTTLNWTRSHHPINLFVPQSYTFMHDNKVIKAPKSTQLYRADSKNNQGCADGRSYTYRVGQPYQCKACITCSIRFTMCHRAWTLHHG